ncbi:MAG: tRNA 2-thiouridine(34) synthase MnmA [Nitrospirae bacterium]|nr:tRNA 2-thiouridine(34) synthase MnmA [Nitrospirota bacterium]MBI3351957.1 tRNA 2-thiouridine(34) synthase MnmA [Nitrospirota bacterium]
MKIAVGMSGGVDSAVTAALLQQQGHEVIGLHLRLYKDEGDEAKHWLDRSCCKIGLAKHVCQQLKLDIQVFDVQDDFRSLVIDNFTDEYKKGRTPNPCVRCNESIKFGTLIEKAGEVGAEALATGHYAKIVYNKITKRYQLLRPKDQVKDQTYFLYRLKQEQLKKILFPLADMEKKEIYKIAEALDFPYEDVLESQEVCFVNQGDYRTFLKDETAVEAPKGEFVSSAGEVMGEHQGIPFYTVGQRRGLGVATGKRQFVIRINSTTNQIVIGDEADLYHKNLMVGDLNWIALDRLSESVQAGVKIRYKSTEAKAWLEPVDEKRIKIIFDEPQKGGAPGQSAVFYQGEVVVGGGVIE